MTRRTKLGVVFGAMTSLCAFNAALTAVAGGHPATALVWAGACAVWGAVWRINHRAFPALPSGRRNDARP